ncbi:MAG: hypothetical protein KI790_04410 [Cyclobacteriaceae bacterium]|nr:hypothetical protein [Cyclobacteriaceae bacterium HetDA_MAG_MS6]
MKLDKAIEASLKNVPKAVAAGVVDMGSGMMLDMKTTASHPQEVFDFLAAATKDMFEGENVVTIENIFKKARGSKATEHYFKEIVVYSTNLLHYFTRLPNNAGVVFAVVCAADANVGLVMVKAREIAKDLEI